MDFNIKTIIFTRQNSTLELLKNYINNFDGFSFLAGTDDCEKAINALAELKNALFLVDVSDYEDEALNMALKVISVNPDTKVIALSDKPNSKTVIKTMRIGVNNFLQLPVLKDKLYEVLNKIKNEFLGIKSESKKCRTISVFSNKGGVGKTSIAMNLALELAKNTKENVALLDLNFQLGDVTTFWDLNPSFDISYMINNSDKLNEEFMLSTFEKYKNNSLYILANPPYYKSADVISVNEIADLLTSMQSVFAYIVIDTSTGFGNKVMKVLEMSDFVFFITTVNLPALRNCQKSMELFEELGLDKNKIKIIINRYMESDDVKLEDVENLLSKKVYWKIPNNYFTMMSAINKAVPVSDINSTSNVAKSYKDLAMVVADSIYRQNLYENVTDNNEEY